MEHHNHGSPSFINIAVLLLFAVVIAVASTATTFYFLNSKTNKQPLIIQPPVVSQTYQTNRTPAISTQKGLDSTIEGSLTYESHGIPDDMKVCAEDIITNEQYCTYQHIKNSKYTYGEGYKLEVPAGSYYIFSFTYGLTYPIDPNDISNKGTKIYYSTKRYGCIIDSSSTCSPSDKATVVTVKKGQTITGIDPN